MRWAEIIVMSKPEAAETVESVLIEEGCRGAATASPSTSFKGEVKVLGYLPVDDLLESRLYAIKGHVRGLKACFDFDIGSLDITVRRIEETDWAESWKAYYKPFVIGAVVIKPTWEPFKPEPGQVVVEMDPGMAFGTGQHPTTQLCVSALQEYVRGGEIVADMGTGSGVLAISAARLGARKAYAIDVDSVAVEAAIQNVRRNGLQDRIFVWQGDSLMTLPEPVDIVVVNILPDVIIELAPQVAEMLKPGGIMISSGIIVQREAAVTAALESAGLETIKAERDGSWVAIYSRKREVKA